MSNPAELPTVLIYWLRVDAIVFIASAAVAAHLVRRRLQRTHAALALPRQTLAAIGVVALAATAAAEACQYAMSGSPTALPRIAIYAFAAIVVGLILHHSVQLVRLRSRLRVHLQAERRLEAAKSAALRSNRAKSDFLVTMSHEIRTPLNALLASADFLVRTASEPAHRAHATTLLNEALRLGSVLNEVLDLRRIEEGRMVLLNTPVSPNDVARDVLRLFSTRASEKRLSLELHSTVHDELTISGDPRRFRQVLANLVDNGIKFTTRGSVTVSMSYVSAATGTGPSWLDVRVVDTGIGLTPEQLACVHGPAEFASSAQQNSSGLGLAIGRQLIRLMGGELRVSSTPGKGSEFAFTLPVVPLISSVTASPAPRCEARQYPGPQPKVLIVDDMEANRMMLQLFFEQHGFVVEHAGGGEEAVTLATTNYYDVILMDINMPDVDGYAATRRIRAAEPAGERTLILAVTACVGEDIRTRCLSAGMDDHFAKPLELRKFCRTVKQLIALKRGEPLDDSPATSAEIKHPVGAPFSQTGL